jgi:hypothetical protein
MLFYSIFSFFFFFISCYFFIILHYENKYIVDYSNIFGDNYKKLVHIITRDKETQIEEYNTLKLDFIMLNFSL